MCVFFFQLSLAFLSEKKKLVIVEWSAFVIFLFVNWRHIQDSYQCWYTLGMGKIKIKIYTILISSPRFKNTPYLYITSGFMCKYTHIRLVWKMGRILKYKNQSGIKKFIHQSNTGIKSLGPGTWKNVKFHKN